MTDPLRMVVARFVLLLLLLMPVADAAGEPSTLAPRHSLGKGGQLPFFHSDE